MQTNTTSKYLQLEHVNLHYLDYGGSGPQTLVQSTAVAPMPTGLILSDRS
jgi:hypothetical protein